MALDRIHIEDRETWLGTRNEVGIGGSEASAILGLNPWMDATKLYRIKTGIETPKEIVGNEFIDRGVRMEDGLRHMFSCLHPELTVEHYPFDILRQTECPWLFATLDGELIGQDGKRGILEIKTAQPKGKVGWDEWKEAVPQKYYVQVLHQLLATGYEYAYLFAALFSQSGDITLREYEFQRQDCLPDMKYLLGKEETFYCDVKQRRIPTITITL